METQKRAASSRLDIQIAILETELKHAHLSHERTRAANLYLLELLSAKMGTLYPTHSNNDTSGFLPDHLTPWKERRPKPHPNFKLLKAENTRLRAQNRRLKMTHWNLRRRSGSNTPTRSTTTDSSTPTTSNSYDLLDLNNFSDIPIDHLTAESSFQSTDDDGNDRDFQARRLGRLGDEFPVPQPQPVRLFVRKEGVGEIEGVEEKVVEEKRGESSGHRECRFNLSGRIMARGPVTLSKSEGLEQTERSGGVALLAPTHGRVKSASYPATLDYGEGDKVTETTSLEEISKEQDSCTKTNEVSQVLAPNPSPTEPNILTSSDSNHTTTTRTSAHPPPASPKALPHPTNPSRPPSTTPPHGPSSLQLHHTYPKPPPPHPRNQPRNTYPARHYPRARYYDIDYAGGTSGPKTYGIPIPNQRRTLLRYDDLDEGEAYNAITNVVRTPDRGVKAEEPEVMVGGFRGVEREGEDCGGQEGNSKGVLVGEKVESTEMLDGAMTEKLLETTKDSEAPKEPDAESDADLMTFPTSPQQQPVRSASSSSFASNTIIPPFQLENDTVTLRSSATDILHPQTQHEEAETEDPTESTAYIPTPPHPASQTHEDALTSLPRIPDVAYDGTEEE